MTFDPLVNLNTQCSANTANRHLPVFVLLFFSLVKNLKEAKVDREGCPKRITCCRLVNTHTQTRTHTHTHVHMHTNHNWMGYPVFTGPASPTIAWWKGVCYCCPYHAEEYKEASLIVFSPGLVSDNCPRSPWGPLDPVWHLHSDPCPALLIKESYLHQHLQLELHCLNAAGVCVWGGHCKWTRRHTQKHTHM